MDKNTLLFVGHTSGRSALASFSGICSLAYLSLCAETIFLLTCSWNMSCYRSMQTFQICSLNLPYHFFMSPQNQLANFYQDVLRGFHHYSITFINQSGKDWLFSKLRVSAHRYFHSVSLPCFSILSVSSLPLLTLFKNFISLILSTSQCGSLSFGYFSRTRDWRFHQCQKRRHQKQQVRRETLIAETVSKGLAYFEFCPMAWQTFPLLK